MATQHVKHDCTHEQEETHAPKPRQGDKRKRLNEGGTTNMSDIMYQHNNRETKGNGTCSQEGMNC